VRGWNAVPMQSAGYGGWTATIPAQTVPGAVEMYVSATDAVGNEAQSPSENVQVLAALPTDAGSSPVLIVAFALAVGVAVAALIFLKRKKKESA